MAFKTTFPVCVPVPALPPLAEMELFDPNKPKEEEVKEEKTPKGKSPRSPRGSPRGSPRSQKEAADKSAKDKGHKEVKEPPKPEIKEPEPEETQPEDRGPDVPIELLRGSLAQLHEKFVADFEEKEKLLVGKIKELEIRMQEKPQVMKKPPPKKK
ncbi:LPXTG-domain-containing protein cell wall anchor [Tritrichomonas foetus]|uniref:LPXTG-domain-containing protein cell wall anchor n=1 Tax=Tritrichomonas foetus TaxID=1144522 RepID=A0A1J4KLE8_9EUKA|nr:LPXTG-domain-containing protein cell wall anchor [Tritrichomonas foetus]|eukprot:OHT11768.1 LPXTG-domain-containing protein cell wall anchor [Tritrichomonas foetus]